MKYAVCLISGYILSTLVILLDYLTKAWAVSVLHPYEPQSVFSVMNWTLAFNTGSAFSLFAQAGPWHQWVLGGFSALMSLIIIFWMTRVTVKKIEFYGLSLILGGAIGNLIDRLHYGYVIDFIDVFYKSYHWPVFNVADSGICLGAALLIIDKLCETRLKKDL